MFEKVARGEAVEPFETVRRRKDGTLVDVSVSVSPIRDREGAVVGASKIARDITERKTGQRETLGSDRARRPTPHTPRPSQGATDPKTARSARIATSRRHRARVA